MPTVPSLDYVLAHFHQLLVRDGLGGAGQGVWGLEDLVNGVHQDASDCFPAAGAALCCEDEVANKDVGIGKWLWQWLVGSCLFRRWKR